MQADILHPEVGFQLSFGLFCALLFPVGGLLLQYRFITVGMSML